MKLKDKKVIKDNLYSDLYKETYHSVIRIIK